jgi:type IV pilus assembly protein PilC
MRFKYKAADLNGKVTEGEATGESINDTLKMLAAQGLKPISVTPIGKHASSRRIFGGGISIKEQIFLTRYLALMLRVGMNLLSAISVLVDNFENPTLKSFLKEVRISIEKGNPLYTAFARYPQYFSPVFTNLVKAGEHSGTLDQVFENLNINLQREMNLRNSIRAALFYPLILFVLASLVLLFLVTFAIPRIAGIFKDTGGDVPIFSKVVFSVGLALGSHPWLVFGGFFAVMIGLYLFFRSTEGKRTLYTIMSHVPILRTVVERVALQRMAVTLSALLQAGLPILDALEITADVIGNRAFTAALQRVAREGLTKGKTLGDAFRGESIFPGVVTSLIAISEQAGQLPSVLETLARFYEEEVNQGIKRLVTVLEPVMLLGIGAVVGLIALSIIVPIYQLVGAFR